MVAGGGFVAVPMYVVMVWDGVQHASEGFFFWFEGCLFFRLLGVFLRFAGYAFFAVETPCLFAVGGSVCSCLCLIHNGRVLWAARWLYAIGRQNCCTPLLVISPINSARSKRIHLNYDDLFSCAVVQSRLVFLALARAYFLFRVLRIWFCSSSLGLCQ